MREIPRNEHFNANVSFGMDFTNIFTCSANTLKRLNEIETKKFLLLHTGRCGSTLLHYLISQYFCPTFEIFSDVAADPITQRLSASLPLDFADYVCEYRDMMFEGLDYSIGSPILSLSISPWQLIGLNTINPGISRWLFRNSTVSILLRTNIIKQAVSHATASATKVWHQFSREEALQNAAEIPTSKSSVLEYLDLILWGEAAIGKKPISQLLGTAASVLHLRYEDFHDSEEVVLRSILHANGYQGFPKKYLSSVPLPIKPIPSRESIKLYAEILDNFPINLASGCVYTENDLFARYNMGV
jgi:hypothetical protein